MVEKVNRLGIKILICVFVAVFFCSNAHADDLVLISDTQTQKYLAKIIKPLFAAANISFDENKIMIVDDDSLNAFVSEGNYVFVNTGTILSADDTNELAGILAHETGHIMGGHIVRQQLKLEKIRYALIGSMLAAGATAVATGRSDAAMAVILGSQSSALNSMFYYQTQEERSADESAVLLLGKTHQSTNGLLRFMKKIKKQYALSGVEENPYFRTHPMTNERISHFKEVAKNNHFSQKSELDKEFLMVKAKLAAFLENPKKAQRMYAQEHNSDAAKYARSILEFREGNFSKSLQTISSLIEKYPNNPYFYELRGQFLFESGQVAKSIADYQKALDLSDAPLIKLSLAHALLENNPNRHDLQKIINLLQQSIISNQTPFAWQLLSRAYAENDETANSYYSAAQYSYFIGDLKNANLQLGYAKKSQPDKSLQLKIKDLQIRIKQEQKDK